MSYRDLIRADTPALYWPLDSTYQANDQSAGGANDGTAGGGIAIGGFSGSPITGETTVTDFAGGFVSSAYAPFINGSVLTLTGWVNRDTAVPAGTLVSNDAAGTVAPLIELSAGTDVRWRPAGTGGALTTWTGAWPGTGQWVHWVLVFDETANTARLYINGALVSSETNASAYNTPSGLFRIGARGTGTNPIDGKMAHVAVFERALTASEIQSHYRAAGGTAQVSSVLIREKPPSRLYVTVETPSGRSYRWGEDGMDPEDVPQRLGFSTVIPGGFESLDTTLPRKTSHVYSDLERLSTIRTCGAGGECAWDGRLERTPRVSGEEVSVSPQAVGWQAHLEDDKTAAEVYVDVDLSHWGSASTQYRLNVGTTAVIHDPQALSNTSTGQPTLFVGTDGGTTERPYGIGVYDAGPSVIIGSVGYAWESQNIGAAFANWDWGVFAGTVDTFDVGTYDTSGNLQATGPGIGTLTPTTSTRRYAGVSASYSTSATWNAAYGIHWYQLAVFGNHGLTKRGTASATESQGLYASDVIANAIGRWAPLLDYTTGADGTIRPTSFVIPQLEFREKTTVAEILKAANRFHLHDWAVWEDRTFHYHERNGRGRRWRARISPANLQETGPQVDRLWNGVVVSYQDVDGTTKTVGPTGAGVDTESDLLLDEDPENPINQMGITRYAVLDMGSVSTPAGATEVGSRFLERSMELDQSGSAELVGHVTDDRGVVHPSWKVRAGDQISFVDASDTSYRRIVKTNYDHDSRTCSIDLDAPPEGMESLLERLGVALFTGIGLPGVPAASSGAVASSGVSGG